MIDLRVTEGAPATDEFVTGTTGIRVAKAMALIGPNGAGKTNALRALAFVRFFVIHSFQMLEPDDEVPVDAFLFRKEKDEPISFEIEISVEGVDYRYSCTLLPSGVRNEALDVRDRSPRYRNLVRRNESSIEISRKGIGLTAGALEKMVRENTSVISVLHHLENPHVKPFVTWLSSVETNIDRITSRHLHAPGWTSFDAAQTFFENAVLLQKAINVLCEADLGLSNVKVEKRKVPDLESGKEETIIIPYGVHNVGGKEYQLPMLMESDGTEGLFVILSKFLPVLERGGCAVINDLDTNLHPDVLPMILHLFLDEETNPKNAQLIFTTHAHEFVFSRLDKRAISIVEKSDGLSSVTRLDSLDRVRTDVDLLKKYRAGLFGGVPNI